MLSQDTADCLALANTAILMQLIQNLSGRSIIVTPKALLENAVHDLEECPEQSLCIEDAIRLIRKKLMPRIAEAQAKFGAL